MKKSFLAMLFLVCAAVFADSADRVDFFIKIKQGNPNVIEKLYVLKFGDSFHYGVDNRVFTANSTNAEKISFIESLKKAGHQIETTDDPNQYFLIVLDSEEQTVLYSVDSSFFKNSPKHIIILQKIFGAAVTGGSKELVKQKKSELPTLRVALENAGFECMINDNTIIIRERRYVRMFKCPDEFKARVISDIRFFSQEISESGQSIRVVISNTQLQELQKRILSSGVIAKINIGQDGIINLLPVPEKKFIVRIMLNNKFEYAKAAPEVEKKSVLRVLDKELQENRLGVSIALFEVSAKNLNASDVKSVVWQAIRNVCPRLKAKDVRVQEKGDN